LGTGISRRGLIAAGATASGLSVIGGGKGWAGQISADPVDPFHVASLQRDLETYDGFGIHRSGGTANRAVLNWMEAEWSQIGYSTTRQCFTVPSHDDYEARLVLPDGATLALAAQPPFRARHEVEGRLCYATLAGPMGQAADAILVAELPNGRHSALDGPLIAPFLAMAREVEARAIILITNGPSDEAIFLNTDTKRDTPLLALAAPSRAQKLRDAALAGHSARLATPAPAGQRPAENLIAQLERDGPRLVISTPLSGWTHCAGERGPGVAVMRALSRWLPGALPDHSLTLFAASGHELAELGGRLWLDNGAPDPKQTALWVHLGAGFAARDWHEPPRRLLPLNHADPQRYLMASPDILPIVRRAFADEPGLANAYPLTPDTAAGELAHIAAHGYPRVFGAFGAHRLHHVMSDRMNAVSGELVAGPARAFRDAIARILAPAHSGE